MNEWTSGSGRLGTRRYWNLSACLCSAFLVAILIGGLRLLAPVEHSLFRGAGLTDYPFPNLMVILGLPHIVIGFLFSVTSKDRASWRGRAAVLAAGLVGAALAWLLHWAGGASGGWRMILVSLLFLAHTYRDELHFYRRCQGDSAGAVHRGQASVARLLLRDSPLWCVYLLIPTLCLLAMPFGGKMYSIVLLHVVGWWVFTTRAQAGKGAEPAGRAAGIWQRVRRTQKGFQWLHGVMVAAAAVLLLCAIHAPAHVPMAGMAWIFTPRAFYYWTIVHVTMSFAPRIS